jgi:hypothetical protein
MTTLREAGIEKKARVRPYDVRACESTYRNAFGWREEALRVEILCPDHRYVAILDGDGNQVGERIAASVLAIRGEVVLDRDNTEAVRWIDGTLIEELDDRIDRQQAALDRAAALLMRAQEMLSEYERTLKEYEIEDDSQVEEWEGDYGAYIDLVRRL